MRAVQLWIKQEKKHPRKKSLANCCQLESSCLSILSTDKDKGGEIKGQESAKELDLNIRALKTLRKHCFKVVRAAQSQKAKSL